MTIHEKAMNLLSQIYESVQQNGKFSISHQTYVNLPSQERMDLKNSLQYLFDERMIKNYAPCAGTPISVTITSDGIREIENIPSNKGTIHFSGNNYGIIGIAVNGNTINQPIPFSEYQKILDKEPLSQEERLLIQEITQDLFIRSKKGYPIEKGMLSKIKDILSQHQALLVPLEELILHYLFSIK